MDAPTDCPPTVDRRARADGFRASDPGRVVRLWALVVVVALGACTAVQFRPEAAQRTGEYRGLAAAVFEVGCDSCWVEWGRSSDTHRRIVSGDWQTYFPLGTIRSGDRVRVRLEADPIGKTFVEGASIEVDGQTVASGRGKKPGHSVRLSAWVGAD